MPQTTKLVACYLELYEEGEVKHINSPTHPFQVAMNSEKLLKGRNVGLIIDFLERAINIAVQIRK